MAKAVSSTASPRVSSDRAQVILIAPEEVSDLSRRVSALWSALLPQATFTEIASPPDSNSGGIVALTSTVRALQTDPYRTVVACLFGAERLGFRLVLNNEQPFCRGLLTCGFGPLPELGFIPKAVNRGMKVRLVWEIEESLQSLVAQLLFSLRSAGVDAQGSFPEPDSSLLGRTGRSAAIMSPTIRRRAGISASVSDYL